MRNRLAPSLRSHLSRRGFAKEPFVAQCNQENKNKYNKVHHRRLKHDVLLELLSRVLLPRDLSFSDAVLPETEALLKLAGCTLLPANHRHSRAKLKPVSLLWPIQTGEVTTPQRQRLNVILGLGPLVNVRRRLRPTVLPCKLQQTELRVMERVPCVKFTVRWFYE